MIEDFETNRSHRPGFDAEDFMDTPTGGWGKRWLAGVVLPCLPFLYGLRYIVLQQGTLYGKTTPLKLQGVEAVALGCVWLAVGIFLHIHYFWGLHPRLVNYHNTGKFVAIVMFLVSMVFLIYRILVVG
jgi:hypothetical protein